MDAEVAQRSIIRLCTEEDIPWMLQVAAEAYPQTDAARSQPAIDWIRERLKEPNLIFLRGDRAIGIANLVERFYAPGRLQCYLLFLYASKADGLSNVWEPFRILDALADWGKENGASAFWYGDVTGFDFEAYAKRRGGRLAGKTYVIDLDGAGRAFG